MPYRPARNSGFQNGTTIYANNVYVINQQPPPVYNRNYSPYQTQPLGFNSGYGVRPVPYNPYQYAYNRMGYPVIGNPRAYPAMHPAMGPAAMVGMMGANPAPPAALPAAPLALADITQVNVQNVVRGNSRPTFPPINAGNVAAAIDALNRFPVVVEGGRLRRPAWLLPRGVAAGGLTLPQRERMCEFLIALSNEVLRPGGALPADDARRANVLTMRNRLQRVLNSERNPV